MSNSIITKVGRRIKKVVRNTLAYFIDLLTILHCSSYEDVKEVSSPDKKWIASIHKDHEDIGDCQDYWIEVYLRPANRAKRTKIFSVFPTVGITVDWDTSTKLVICCSAIESTKLYLNEFEGVSITVNKNLNWPEFDESDKRVTQKNGDG